MAYQEEIMWGSYLALKDFVKMKLGGITQSVLILEKNSKGPELKLDAGFSTGQKNELKKFAQDEYGIDSMCLEYCALKESRNYFTDAYVWKYDKNMIGIVSPIDDNILCRKGFNIEVKSGGIVCLSAVGLGYESNFVPRSVILIKKREKYQVFDYAYSQTGLQTTVEAFLSAGTWLLIVTSFPAEPIGIKAYCKPDSVTISLADQNQFSLDDLWKQSMIDMVQTTFKDKEFGEIMEGGREVLYHRQKYDQGGFHVEVWKNPTSREVVVSKAIELIENIKINVLDDELFNPEDLSILKFRVPGSGQRVIIYEFCGVRPNVEFGHVKLE